jgi:hypothetical protein
MEAERTFVNRNGDKVDEFAWGSKTVVYINNTLTDKTFNQVVSEWVEYYEKVK